MKTSLVKSGKSCLALTLTEVLVVVALIMILTCVKLPALSHAKVKSASAACLSNLKQLQLGALMYSSDNNDFLILNAPYGNPDSQNWCGCKQMNWQTANINTNQAYYRSSIIAPYLASSLGVYRCPADTVPSDNGQRIRSYSMNGQMGMGFAASSSPILGEDSGAKYYVKTSDVIAPAPSSAIIFVDENTYTLLGPVSDCYLQISTSTGGWPDVPSARHANGCGLSYADGHTEVHKWQTSILSGVPSGYGQIAGGGAWGVPQSSVIGNSDYIWWSQHTACKSNGQLGP